MKFIVMLAILISFVSIKSNAQYSNTENYATGGVVGTVLGHGIGHAMQKRWKDRGWIFSANQVYGDVFLLLALKTDNLGYLTIGAIPTVTSRLTEIIDVWAPRDITYVDSNYELGGVVGTIFGHGIGHAVQGRYKDKGWIFTLGQIVGTGLIVNGLIQDDSDYLIVGASSSLISRLTEILDVWGNPNNSFGSREDYAIFPVIDLEGVENILRVGFSLHRSF